MQYFYNQPYNNSISILWLLLVMSLCYTSYSVETWKYKIIVPGIKTRGKLLNTSTFKQFTWFGTFTSLH